MFDVIIIGAGIAGMTANLYANRAGLKVFMIEKGLFGGQIINTPVIENYPCVAGASGYDLMQSLYDQSIKAFDTPIVYEEIVECELDKPVKKIVTSKNTYEAKTVILAAGAEHRELGCNGEAKFKGRGVSYCATCDGAFFKGKAVAVVGGGNTALQDARVLSAYCEKVYLIHRRDEFRASKIEIESALKQDGVEAVYDTVVEEITGNMSVESVLVRNVKTNQTTTIPVSGVFVAVGTTPSSEQFLVDKDEYGYIIASEDCKTNLSGVFVAGDVRTKQVRQLVTAASDGAVSAQMALDFITQEK